MVDTPWRARLRPASFRGVPFHVEVGARAGGRRVVPHEYPKRDDPYTEDMGRRVRRHAVTGYCIGPEFFVERDDLIDALEAAGPGLLVHPTQGEFDVNCDGFNAIERRERGGYVEIEMTFVEAGSRNAFGIAPNTGGAAGDVADKAASAEGATTSAFSVKAGPR